MMRSPEFSGVMHFNSFEICQYLRDSHITYKDLKPTNTCWIPYILMAGSLRLYALISPFMIYYCRKRSDISNQMILKCINVDIPAATLKKSVGNAMFSFSIKAIINWRINVFNSNSEHAFSDDRRFQSSIVCSLLVYIGYLKRLAR